MEMCKLYTLSEKVNNSALDVLHKFCITEIIYFQQDFFIYSVLVMKVCMTSMFTC